MNDTLGADCIGSSTVTKYFREKILEVGAWHGFRAENWRGKFHWWGNSWGS
jgi:hypothetical protein